MLFRSHLAGMVVQGPLRSGSDAGRGESECQGDPADRSDQRAGGDGIAGDRSRRLRGEQFDGGVVVERLEDDLPRPLEVEAHPRGDDDQHLVERLGQDRAHLLGVGGVVEDDGERLLGQRGSEHVPALVGLVVGATGVGPFSFQWQLNGTPLNGATTPVLNLNTVQLTDSGNYSCLITTPLGSLTSSNALLTVFSPFSFRSTAFQFGGLFQLTATGDDGHSYRLEASTNLVDWVPVVTNTISSGTGTFTDSSASGQPQRFYRLILIP